MISELTIKLSDSGQFILRDGTANPVVITFDVKELLQWVIHCSKNLHYVPSNVNEVMANPIPMSEFVKRNAPIKKKKKKTDEEKNIQVSGLCFNYQFFGFFHYGFNDFFSRIKIKQIINP